MVVVLTQGTSRTQCALSGSQRIFNNKCLTVVIDAYHYPNSRQTIRMYQFSWEQQGVNSDLLGVGVERTSALEDALPKRLAATFCVTEKPVDAEGCSSVTKGPKPQQPQFGDFIREASTQEQ